MSRPLRALVVDDERSWQRILGEILRDAGLEVDVAASLSEAEAMLQAAPHRLAVVDLSLGGGDRRDQAGLAVLDAVRRLDPGCVSLLLTGYATVELAVSALSEHGALTCLRKEAFRRAQFREILGRALGQAPPALVVAPADEPAAPQPPPASAPDAALPAGLALLAEDDAGWRRILEELLVEAGYRVRACASAAEARGCLRHARYDLAVVDLSLASSLAPEANQDGRRLLSAARKGAIPTIVVSGTASAADLDGVYAEYGVSACLEKQAFDRRGFLCAVAEARTAEPAPQGALQLLTERERQVLELLARGLTNQDIAEGLVITPNTVKRHLKAIFEKLGVHTRAAAAAKAIDAGLPAGPEKGSQS